MLMPVSGTASSLNPSSRRGVAFQNAPVPEYAARKSAAAAGSSATMAAARPEVSSLAMPGRVRGVHRRRDRHGRLAALGERPLVAERMIVRRQRRGDLGSSAASSSAAGTSSSQRSLDQQQVEPVADAEPVQAPASPGRAACPRRRTRRRRARRRRRRARASGRRAGARSVASSRVLSPLPRRMTSGTGGLLDQRLAESRPGTRTSWIASGSRPASPSAGPTTWSTQGDGRAERGRAGAQHARVARLHQLRGDVDHHVGPGLEVGADRCRPAAGTPPEPGRRAARGSPPGRRRRGVGERSRTGRPMSASRASSSRSRSSRPVPRPAASPASTSRRFAASTGSVDASAGRPSRAAPCRPARARRRRSPPDARCAAGAAAATADAALLEYGHRSPQSASHRRASRSGFRATAP